MKIDEVVRGQVAELFGKFRPAQGLSADEVKAIGQERREWAQRLSAQLKSIEAGVGVVIRHFRDVVREVKNEPSFNRMPEPSEIAGRVERRCLAGTQMPWCPVCERFGHPGIFRDSPEGAKRRGAIRFGDRAYCASHFEVLVWYLTRHMNFAEGRAFDYPPPKCVIPKGVWRNGIPPALLMEYTDGVFVDGFVEWTRKEASVLVDAQLLESPSDTVSA